MQPQVERLFLCPVQPICLCTNQKRLSGAPTAICSMRGHRCLWADDVLFCCQAATSCYQPAVELVVDGTFVIGTEERRLPAEAITEDDVRAATS